MDREVWSAKFTVNWAKHDSGNKLFSHNMPSLCLTTIFQGVSGNEGLALALVTLDDLVERRKDTYGVVGDPSKYIVWMPVQG